MPPAVGPAAPGEGPTGPGEGPTAPGEGPRAPGEGATAPREGPQPLRGGRQRPREGAKAERVGRNVPRAGQRVDPAELRAAGGYFVIASCDAQTGGVRSFSTVRRRGGGSQADEGRGRATRPLWDSMTRPPHPSRRG